MSAPRYAPDRVETINEHLYNGNLECGSCHSVHNTGNAVRAPAVAE